MSVREYLQMREEALGSALDALVEDEREALANGYRDLARAYYAGQRVVPYGYAQRHMVFAVMERVP